MRKGAATLPPAAAGAGDTSPRGATTATAVEEVQNPPIVATTAAVRRTIVLPRQATAFITPPSLVDVVPCAGGVPWRALPRTSARYPSFSRLGGGVKKNAAPKRGITHQKVRLCRRVARPVAFGLSDKRAGFPGSARRPQRHLTSASSPAVSTPAWPWRLSFHTSPAAAHSCARDANRSRREVDTSVNSLAMETIRSGRSSAV
jgi:hypothetical protein